MMWNIFLLFISLCFSAGALAAEQNITIDDFDRTAIVYSPVSSWQSSSDASTRDRYAQTTTFTRTQGASASFTFGGAIAIYFGGYGEIDLIPGTLSVIFDGATTTVSGNNDPSRPAQQVQFSRKGLDPKKNYTITVQKTSQSGAHDLNVDFFTYTLPDPASSSPSPSPSPTPVNQNEDPPVAAIAGGIAAGVVVLIGLLIAFVIMRRRRRKLNREKVDLNGTLGHPHHQTNYHQSPTAQYVTAPHPTPMSYGMPSVAYTVPYQHSVTTATGTNQTALFTSTASSRERSNSQPHLPRPPYPINRPWTSTNNNNSLPPLPVPPAGFYASSQGEEHGSSSQHQPLAPPPYSHSDDSDSQHGGKL